jgi:hypothetical protein
VWEEAMNKEPEVFLVPEFCRHYKISKTSFYKEVSEKRLCLIKRGRRTIIARQEAERWFTSLCQQNHPQQTA